MIEYITHQKIAMKHKQSFLDKLFENKTIRRSKILSRIYFFLLFISDCIRYFKEEVKESWGDMNTRYYLRFDKEFQDVMKKANKLENKNNDFCESEIYK